MGQKLAHVKKELIQNYLAKQNILVRVVDSKATRQIKGLMSEVLDIPHLYNHECHGIHKTSYHQLEEIHR